MIMRRVFIAFCRTKRKLRAIKREMKALGARVITEMKRADGKIMVRGRC